MTARICTNISVPGPLSIFTLIVQGTNYAHSASIEYVRVYFRRPNIRMAEQFLNSTKIIAILQQSRGKTMPKSVRLYRLIYGCLFDSLGKMFPHV